MIAAAFHTIAAKSQAAAATGLLPAGGRPSFSDPHDLARHGKPECALAAWRQHEDIAR